MLEIGSVLKQRYRVVSILGEGGMSTVYLVEDLTLDSKWAMKETLDFFPDRNRSEILDQFKKEAKILANISHPNLPRVIDYFVQNDRHYLVEEYIEARPLSDALGEMEDFDEKKILDLAVQICNLLEFLHTNGIIYRDLKPGNILIDKQGKVYLVDFGIARFFQGGKARDTVIIGTPGFASPEHYGRGQTDCRSDVFSLGATLHYMVTGTDPADQPFNFEIPYVINPRVSFQTSSIIMKCLDLDPARRFQSASEVKEAIEKRALPALEKKTETRMLIPDLTGPEKYINQTDLLGETAKFLSYTSILPASMGVSGLLAYVAGVLGPITSFLVGTVSFPIICLQFWNRLNRVYRDQEVAIEVGKRSFSYRSKTLHLQGLWHEVEQVVIIKNRGRFSTRKIKEIQVKTRSGDFSFDASFNEYRRLIDIIIVRSGLRLAEDEPGFSVYRKF